VRFRAAVVVAAIIAGIGLPTLGAAVPASAADPAHIAVTASPADFGVVRSGQPIRLFVTIEDQVGNGLAAGSATVNVERSPVSSSTALSNWLGGSTKSSVAAAKIGTVATPAVEPGLSKVVQVIIPARSARLGSTGVYALAVSVTVDGKVVATSRTAITWKAPSAPSVPIAIAAPLTVPASTGTFIDSKTLATYTAPDGILTDELAQLENTQVAIGIDPRILASIRVLGRSAPQSAIDWLQQLESVTNETFPLQWADADLTIALHAGAKTIPVPRSLDFAIDPGLFKSVDTDATPEPTPTVDPSNPPLPTSASLVAFNYTLPNLSWPAENSIVSSDVQGLVNSGITAAIVSSGNLSRSASRTPPGASASVGAMSAFVSDDGLSSYLRDAASATTRSQFTASMAGLSAASQLVSSHSSGTAPIMLATLGRDWATNDQYLAQALQGVASLPWVSTGELTQVAQAPPTKATIAKRPQSSIRASLVHSMLADEARVRRFAEIAAPDQQQLTSTRRMMLLSLLSDEWLADPTGWRTEAEGYLSDSRDILASVSPAASSTVLLLNDSGSLPIILGNGLDQGVTVYIAVRPRSTQLTVEKQHRLVEVHIPASSQHRVLIPVQSIANGTGSVLVELYSKSGLRIGKATVIRVNVQAGWETIGTLIFGALVVAIFAVGIVRTIRRRRRSLRGGDDRNDDPTDDAAGHEPESADT